MPPDDDLATRLAGVLGVPRVEGLQRMAGGASRETWSFRVPAAGAASQRGQRLILRRDPPGATRITPTSSMGHEAAAIRAAEAASVPVPTVVAASEDAALVGSPFIVMHHVDGETIPRRILREDSFADVRPRLAGQCGAALAGIHSIDRAAVPGLADVDQLAHYRGVLDEIAEPHPAFELALRWLERNRPPQRERCVVHGDFRHGNLIISPERLSAVLDWELVHLGDPMEDLGWVCVKAWRFGSALPVGGFGHYEDLVAGYEGAGSAPVDRDAMAWWELFGVLKWGIICIMQAVTHLTGNVRSVELAAIGRRVCETEWDLLQMLDVRR
jgi:aminoglycoside phosphotransferase (APT) family kinase protein